MKGVLLCGGAGTRMGLVTKRITNKHLLPIYDGNQCVPMILYPIKTLVEAGVTDICIVTGGRYKGAILDTIGDGKEFGIDHITYEFQMEEGGIAQALSLAESFVQYDNCAVILGDNYYQSFDLKPTIQKFDQECPPSFRLPLRAGASDKNKDTLLDFWKSSFGKVRQTCQIKGDWLTIGNASPKAGIFLSQVSDPQRFGVVEFNDHREQTIKRVVEKPKTPPSNWAVTGLYLYDHHVWEYIRTIKPSSRGELEITDVNQHYCNAGGLQAHKLKTLWTDMGTPESIARLNHMVYKEGLR